MEEVWQKACHHYDVPEDVQRNWLNRIQQRMNDPSQVTRTYHSWNELMMRKREHLLHCKPAIIMAAFFQYYEYDGTRNCATENCQAFKEFCQDAQIDDEESKSLILKLLGDTSATVELSDTYEEDANMLQDLDLVILASAPADYKTYTQLLRREYDNMNDDSYDLMRLKVLETLLIIPNVFSTLKFQTKFEEAARANIKREIDYLKRKHN